MRSPTKILCFIILLLLTPPGSVGAQPYVGGSAMVNAGYMWTPALSSSLHSVAGNPIALQKGYPIIGAEINYRNGNAVVVLSSYFGTQEGKRINGQLIEPFVWKTNAGFGWIVLKTKSLFVYPVLGAGSMGSSLTYYNTMDSHEREITRSTSLDCSIHTDYFLNKPRTKEEFVSVAMVSLRLGYTKGISVKGLQGFSVTVSFGGLSFMKNKQSP